VSISFIVTLYFNLEGNNICVNNVNVNVLQILKVSDVKEVRTLLSLTGMLMGIGTVPVMLWFSDFRVQNLLTILTAWGSHP
jgi:hypothetical protein